MILCLTASQNEDMHSRFELSARLAHSLNLQWRLFLSLIYVIMKSVIRAIMAPSQLNW